MMVQLSTMITSLYVQVSSTSIHGIVVFQTMHLRYLFLCPISDFELRQGLSLILTDMRSYSTQKRA